MQLCEVASLDVAVTSVLHCRPVSTSRQPAQQQCLEGECSAAICPCHCGGCSGAWVCWYAVDRISASFDTFMFVQVVQMWPWFHQPKQCSCATRGATRHSVVQCGELVHQVMPAGPQCMKAPHGCWPTSACKGCRCSCSVPEGTVWANALLHSRSAGHGGCNSFMLLIMRAC